MDILLHDILHKTNNGYYQYRYLQYMLFHIHIPHPVYPHNPQKTR